MNTKIIDKPLSIEKELVKLSLDHENLITVIRYAESEKALCTENDPVGFGSFTAYARAGRKLREIYVPKGWEKDDSHNQCAIRHPEKNIRIVPCNFNESAGDISVDPTNKSPKGEVSRKKSISNYTLLLPGIPEIEPRENEAGDITWVLGFFMEDDFSITAELSLPIDFANGFYTKFSKRIILLNGSEGYADKVVSHSTEDTFKEIDINIKRK